MADCIEVPQRKIDLMWREMQQHLELHNNYVRMKVADEKIVSEYMFCMGMLKVMRNLGLKNKKTLNGYEESLYKLYEQ